MRILKSYLIAGAGVVTLVASSISPASALEKFERNDSKALEIGSTPHVSIETISGDVRYTGVEGTKATVEIQVDIRADDAKEADEIRSHLELVVDGESGFLDVRMADSRAFYKWLRSEYSSRHSVSVSFYVNGPRGAEGTLTSVSGNVFADNIAGPIELSSVSGNDSVSNVQGRVRCNSTSGEVDVLNVGSDVIASSVSGEVTVTSCAGDLDIESTSGDVAARAVGGMVRASTVSGDIELTDVSHDIDAESTSGSVSVESRAGDIRVSSVSGDVRVQTKTSGNVDLETLSGSVELAVVPDAFGSVILAASSGDINSTLPISVTRKTRTGLEGKLGTGTASLRVTTSSGDIELSEL